ncbi:hypothetical protein [Vibrio cionasavignyae]|uniref:hypothetical protein n=1 Tax=Vibrio cionasavignyae TaxID=2910252 RepID=UPI003D0CB0B5
MSSLLVAYAPILLFAPRCSLLAVNQITITTPYLIADRTDIFRLMRVGAKKKPLKSLKNGLRKMLLSLLTDGHKKQFRKTSMAKANDALPLPPERTLSSGACHCIAKGTTI